MVLNKLEIINPNIIFDAGANIGEYALLASKSCPNAKIYCFEPVESTFHQLQTNLSKVDAAILVNKGLSAKNENIMINLYEASAHSSVHNIKGITAESSKKEQIEVVSGDLFMQENGIEQIDLLKLDIEGGEMSALKGFSTALQRRRIRAIQFEYGYINISTKDLLLDFYDFFDSFGYGLGKIYPNKVEFREYRFKHEDFIGPNYLAIHKDDIELKKILS